MSMVSKRKIGNKRLSEQQASRVRSRNVNYQAQSELLWDKKLENVSDIYKQKRNKNNSRSPKYNVSSKK